MSETSPMYVNVSYVEKFIGRQMRMIPKERLCTLVHPKTGKTIGRYKVIWSWPVHNKPDVEFAEIDRYIYEWEQSEYLFRGAV